MPLEYTVLSQAYSGKAHFCDNNEGLVVASSYKKPEKFSVKTSSLDKEMMLKGFLDGLNSSTVQQKIPGSSDSKATIQQEISSETTNSDPLPEYTEFATDQPPKKLSFFRRFFLCGSNKM